VAHLELLAPEKLNSVDESMLSAIETKLRIWDHDPQIALIVLSSPFEKAFCAGGDVKGLAQQMLARPQDRRPTAMGFFRQEYRTDYLIHTLKQPTLCLADGITMGGGIGLMQGCKLRIVTERTVLAMPELAIGFFPDVGGSYFLPRLKHNSGWWMAFTGARLTGSEAVATGLADQQIKVSDKRKIMVELLRLPWKGDSVYDLGLLEAFFEHVSVKPQVDHDLFKKTEGLVLDQGYEAFLDSVGRDEFHAFGFSPLSSWATFEIFQRNKNKTLAQCFVNEWTLAVSLCESGDFVEGIRAQLIDKDKTPKWKPFSRPEEFTGLFVDQGQNLLAVDLGC